MEKVGILLTESKLLDKTQHYS